MAVYLIKNESGEVINRIEASLEFVQSQYEFYEIEEPDVSDQIHREAIMWRNRKLTETDAAIIAPDYPYVEQLKVFRQALRDWPSTEGFPYNPPTLEV
jgi:hypothetical protein